jgi:Fe-Mn family superoxide dismutase
MPHQLPDLSYSVDSLEPHIDARTMEIHHGKHHQTYVNNLNAALEGNSALADKPVNELITDLSQIPEDIRGTVRNNGGGHSNHTFFWEVISPSGGGIPSGSLGDAITSAFGSFDSFKDAFTKAALTRFGSGWAWLIKSGDSVQVTSTPNQDSPLMEGIADDTGLPLIGLDVWEHAYYFGAFWNVVDWDRANALFEK